MYTKESEDVICHFERRGFRLPTEAEWEYAAIGGKKFLIKSFPKSQTYVDPEWYEYNNSSIPNPVRTFPANELGIYGMGGDWQEWCWDFYQMDFTSKNKSDKLINPRGASFGETKVIRGDIWQSPPENDHRFIRHHAYPLHKWDRLGFRFVI